MDFQDLSSDCLENLEDTLLVVASRSGTGDFMDVSHVFNHIQVKKIMLKHVML